MSGTRKVTVSCVIPAWNAERWIGEALDSVLGQTRPPDEVVVVDDGSTDDTAAVVASYGERVRCLRQENAGPAAARNRGVAVSRGTLLAFQDADDVWLPEKLERQLDRLDARPELEVCLTHLRNFWIDELKAEEERLRDHPLAKPSVPGWVPQTMVVRREALERVGPFAEHLRTGEDTDWFLRARESGAVIEVVPEVLVLRRQHHTNLTRLQPPATYLADVVARSLARRRAGSDDPDEAPSSPPRPSSPT